MEPIDNTKFLILSLLVIAWCVLHSVGIAVLLFFLGGRHYDARQVLGIKQIREGTSNKVITDTGEFDTSGILGLTRHPWYLATILFIWARQLDVSAILVNVILTSYLIIGTYLEEKKLIGEFGEGYLTYQKRVSMLMPYKWLWSKIKNLQSPPNHTNSVDS